MVKRKMNFHYFMEGNGMSDLVNELIMTPFRFYSTRDIKFIYLAYDKGFSECMPQSYKLL